MTRVGEALRCTAWLLVATTSFSSHAVPPPPPPLEAINSFEAIQELDKDIDGHWEGTTDVLEESGRVAYQLKSTRLVRRFGQSDVILIEKSNSSFDSNGRNNVTLLDVIIYDPKIQTYRLLPTGSFNPGGEKSDYGLVNLEHSQSGLLRWSIENGQQKQTINIIVQQGKWEEKREVVENSGKTRVVSVSHLRRQ